jgi:hypothetical protein
LGGFDFQMTAVGMAVIGLIVLALCASVVSSIAAAAFLVKGRAAAERARLCSLTAVGLAAGALVLTLLFFTPDRFPNAGRVRTNAIRIAASPTPSRH